MQKQKFYYVGDRKGNSKTGVMTIATEVQDDNSLKVSFAFCSPKDNFSKVKGREKAIGRLNSAKEYKSCEFTGNSGNDAIELFNDLRAYVHVETKTDKDGNKVEVRVPVISHLPHIWKRRKLTVLKGTGVVFIKEGEVGIKYLK